MCASCSTVINLYCYSPGLFLTYSNCTSMYNVRVCTVINYSHNESYFLNHEKIVNNLDG